MLSPAEVAKQLNVNYRTVLRLIDRGKLPARNISDGAKPVWRVSAEHLTAYRTGADNVATKPSPKPSKSRFFD